MSLLYIQSIYKTKLTAFMHPLVSFKQRIYFFECLKNKLIYLSYLIQWTLKKSNCRSRKLYTKLQISTSEFVKGWIEEI